MRLARGVVVALSVVCLVRAPAAAGPVIENVPAANGQVNWSEAALRAEGAGVRPRDAESPAQARLLARRAAIADAFRNLAQLISEVRVTGDTKVERYLATSDTVRTAVEAFIRGARVVEEREDPDGTFRVALQLGMMGPQALSGIVLPGVLSAPTETTLEVQAGVETQVLTPAPAPGLEEELLTAADAQGPFTGLIIDARGLNVQPAMSPRVYDAAGNEVYGTVTVDAAYAEDVGVAGYMGTIRASLGLERVGKNPLVIRATGTPDEFHRCVTISEADARRIAAANTSAKFLQKCAVVLVVDERRARDEGK